jgi:hypothetical protein
MKINDATRNRILQMLQATPPAPYRRIQTELGVSAATVSQTKREAGLPGRSASSTTASPAAPTVTTTGAASPAGPAMPGLAPPAGSAPGGRDGMKEFQPAPPSSPASSPDQKRSEKHEEKRSEKQRSTGGEQRSGEALGEAPGEALGERELGASSPAAQARAREFACGACGTKWTLTDPEDPLLDACPGCEVSFR